MYYLSTFDTNINDYVMTKIYSLNLFYSIIENDNQQSLSDFEKEQITAVLLDYGKVSTIVNDHEITLYSEEMFTTN